MNVDPKKISDAVGILFIGVIVAFIIVNQNHKEPERNIDFSDYDVVYRESSENPHQESYEWELQPKLEIDTTDYGQYYLDTITQEGVEWASHPEPLGDLGLVKKKTYGDKPEGVGGVPLPRLYYKIGTDQGNDIIVTTLPCDGICFVDLLSVFIKIQGDYYLVTQHSAGYGEEYGLYALADGVGSRGDILYEALMVPEQIEVSGEQLSTRWGGTAAVGAFFANARNNNSLKDGSIWEFEAQTKYGPMFRSGGIIDEGPSQLVSQAIRLPGGLVVYYYPEYPFVGDDGIPQIVWSDGTQNTEPYKPESVGGCGSWGRVEVLDVNDVVSEDITLAGYTSNNKLIYKFTNPDHPVVVKFFNLRGGKYYTYDETTRQTVTRDFTKEDIINAPLLFLYKDGLGRYVVFSSTVHAPAAECAKPVIYLYPEVPIQVSVEVGATITKSDPEYKDGWKVIANPDGLLVHKGKTYESLFWDGIGYGEYPLIRSGFVVAREDVEKTLTDHLVRQGLNNKERKDFLEFWLPYMPTTPYVRLTWLSQAEIDELAPLNIKPKPDTTIRVFLDFQGLDEYKELQPRDLSAPVRDGFTLVEWGGLLIQ